MTDSPNASGALPTLAYVYHPRSFGTLSLVEAGRGVCELLWVIDTTNPEMASMSRLLRKVGPIVDVAGLSVQEAADLVAEHQPAGILALADDMLRWTADLAVALRLPFLSPETAYRLTDKFAQRAAFAAAGLAVPKSWVIASADDPVWSDIERDAAFPAVLKPRRGEASRDTVPVSSFGELRELWAANTSLDEKVREFVLEEYIADSLQPVAGEGFANYVSVESFVSNGTISHLAVNGRTPPAYPFRETGFFIPSALSSALEGEVLQLAAAAAAAVGVDIGFLHTEIKLTPSGPVVIEVNGRIGGGVPELLFLAAGLPVLSYAMRIALGEHLHHGRMPEFARLAYLFYVQAPAEMRGVSAVEGLDELRQVDGVEEIILNRGPGQRVDWREGNHGHVVSVLGTAADHDGLRRAMKLTETLVRIQGT